MGVASGEYLDPRFDGVPLEWDEHDDFDALRSVEADVALTLQVLTRHSPLSIHGFDPQCHTSVCVCSLLLWGACKLFGLRGFAQSASMCLLLVCGGCQRAGAVQAAAMPAGMGSMLPFGGDTDEEDESPGVQLEGRMGYAGSSLSIDEADLGETLDLLEAVEAEVLEVQQSAELASPVAPRPADGSGSDTGADSKAAADAAKGSGSLLASAASAAAAAPLKGARAAPAAAGKPATEREVRQT